MKISSKFCLNFRLGRYPLNIGKVWEWIPTWVGFIGYESSALKSTKHVHVTLPAELHTQKGHSFWYYTENLHLAWEINFPKQRA